MLHVIAKDAAAGSALLNYSWHRLPGTIGAYRMTHVCADHAATALEENCRYLTQVHQMVH